MAITIHQQPQTLSPGFNDLIYVVSSNNTSQANFQYVCDIYLTNDAGAVTFAGQSYLREKTPVDPIYSSGVFNISRKIESYLSYDVSSGTTFLKSPNSVIQVICKFGEEYGPSSGITVTADLATATTMRAWNGIFDLPDFKDYSKSTFVGNTLSTTRRFLTDRPSSGVIRTDENAWLSTLVESTTEVLSLKLRTYDSAGALVGDLTDSTIAIGALNTVGQYMQRIPVGTRQLTAIFGQNTFNNVARYRVDTGNDSGDQDRESQWYVIDDTCTDHDIYRLHFWNKLGGFDSFSFIRAHTEETNITQRDKFKRNLTTRIGGGSYGYNKYDLSDVNFYTRHKDTIKVTSDWISESTSAWLEQLVTSPVVFHDHPTHGWLAINISDTRHIRRQWITDGLSNLEITFTYSFDRYRQRL